MRDFGRFLKVNGASTKFQWPSEPTETSEPAAASIQTYRNSLVGFEFDYPAGWLPDNAGAVDMVWSERLKIAAFANSVSLLTIINGHPVMIVNYGNTGHFDEIANSLRVIRP